MSDTTEASKSKRAGGARAAHTPGPWQADTDPHPGSVLVREDAFMVRARGCTVAEVIPQNSARANAQLIAAAPDLLEALKELLEESEAFEENGDRFDKERNDRARAAIAKAVRQ